MVSSVRPCALTQGGRCAGIPTSQASRKKKRKKHHCLADMRWIRQLRNRQKRWTMGGLVFKEGLYFISLGTHRNLNASPKGTRLYCQTVTSTPTALETSSYGNSFVLLPISGLTIAHWHIRRRGGPHFQHRRQVLILTGFLSRIFQLSLIGTQTMVGGRRPRSPMKMPLPSRDGF